MNNIVLDILSKCNSEGVSIKLKKENLGITSKKENVSTDLVKLIKQYKPELVDHFKKLHSLQDYQEYEPTVIKPYNRTQVIKAPLSFSQQRLWFIDRLEPGNPQYNMPAGIRLQSITYRFLRPPN